MPTLPDLPPLFWLSLGVCIGTLVSLALTLLAVLGAVGRAAAALSVSVKAPGGIEGRANGAVEVETDHEAATVRGETVTVGAHGIDRQALPAANDPEFGTPARRVLEAVGQLAVRRGGLTTRCQPCAALRRFLRLGRPVPDSVARATESGKGE